MSEWRKLYRNVSDSKRLGKLSNAARLLYTWMLPWTDCEGRMFADPDLIKGKIFPKCKDWKEKDIEKALREIHHSRLIQLFIHDGETYLQYQQPQFKEFQNPRMNKERASKIPSPSSMEISTLTPEFARPCPAKSGEDGSRAEEEKRREEKRREEKRVAREEPANGSPSLLQQKKVHIGMWNIFAEKHKLKKIISIADGSAREKHFKARLNDGPFNFLEILKQAEDQEFLFGKNEKRWKVTFDWLIENPGNYIKVLEQKFLDEDTKSTWADRRSKKGETS